MKKRVENAPLLYIVQPNLGPKTCYMQQTFRTKKKSRRIRRRHLRIFVT